MKNYKNIPEEKWEEKGVEIWDPTDPEDGGWRDCPSCEGKSYEEPWKYHCETCNGVGDVQWS